MKSKLIEEKKKDKYPCLKESFEDFPKTGKMVVLFTRPNQGVIVYSTWSCGNSLGDYSWCWNEDKFHLFEGEIKLTNE